MKDGSQEGADTQGRGSILRHKRGGWIAFPAFRRFGRGDERMFLVVGLGNPGNQYAHTRHNVGFDVVDILAQKLNIRVGRLRCQALVGEGQYNGRRIALCKPQTYMNESGRSVAALMQWYKPEQLVVVYDDVDLPIGKIRIRAAGSAGTHNGMRSILEHLGQGTFPRVRVGIGRQPQGWELADWVLSHYATAEERKIAFDAYVNAAEALLCMADTGVEAAMKAYNGKNGN